MLPVHIEVSHNLELINSTRWNALIDELLLRPVSLHVICHQLMHVGIYIITLRVSLTFGLDFRVLGVKRCLGFDY